MAKNIQNLLAASALSVLLVACGGGGGGGSLLGSGFVPNLNGGGSSNNSVQIVVNNNLVQSDPATFLTGEYNNNTAGGHTGLAQINAAVAYGLGATGAGITVGIIDTGIDFDNVEFAGAISADSINIINNNPNDLQGINPHGTWTAGVIGARKNGIGTHGVAFNSELLVVKADTIQPGQPGCAMGCFTGEDLAKAVNYATAHGANIINMSLGAGGNLGANLTNAIRNAAANNVLIVTAAGNAGVNSVDNPANLGGTAGIAGNLLAVGAVDVNNQILNWSNRAGNAKNWYLVAPGHNVLTTDEGGMALVAGTSFAAPMVSGAAALVMEYAPYLTAKQTAQILLRTATDLGAPGVDAVYGHGLLNVGAALQPVGDTSVPTGQGNVAGGNGGGNASTSATTLALGSAFGDALANNGLLARGIMTDEFGRAFGFNMNSRVQRAAYDTGLAQFIKADEETTTNGMMLGAQTSLVSSFTDNSQAGAVRDLDQQAGLQGDLRLALNTQATENVSVAYTHGYGIGQAFGLQAENAELTADLTKRDAFSNAYLGLVQGGNAVLTGINLSQGLTLTLGTGMESKTASLTSNVKTTGDRQGYAAALNYEMGRFSLGLTAGMVNEGNSTLGSNSDGALSFGAGSSTTFVGASAAIDLAKGLTLAATYQAGMTSIKDADNSIIGDFQGLRSDSFAVALTAQDVAQKNDRLTLAISQPVRINDGDARLNVATGVDASGNVIYNSQRVGLTPSGRQLDLQAGYSFAINENETLAFSTVGTLNPGHDATADAGISVGVRYRKKF